MTQDVTLALKERVAIVTLNRPKVFNCLSSNVMDLLAGMLEDLERDRGVRAMLLRSDGEHFSTGAELTELESIRTRPDAMHDFLRKGHATLVALENSRLPVIAAVQGLCLAGGLELMLACDVVFAANDARFGDQHARFGLVPGWGGSQRLPRCVGQRRALDLMFSGRWIDATTAAEWGLVSYLAEPGELEQDSFDYCRKIADFSSAGLGFMKKLANAANGDAFADRLAAEAGLAGTLLTTSADVEEGLAAFKARRQPQF